MFELDEASRRALSQRYGPTPEAQARVLGELRSNLGGPAGPEGGGGEGGGQVVWIAKIVAATAGLTGAGLLVLKLGASVVGGGDVREAADVPEKIDAPEPTRVAPTVSDAPEIQANVDAELPAARSVAVPIQTPTKRREAGSSLAAEIALVDAAQRIRVSDPEAALVYLEQHRKEFPTGALAPEREALRVEVSCELGRMSKVDCVRMGSDKSGD